MWASKIDSTDISIDLKFYLTSDLCDHIFVGAGGYQRLLSGLMGIRNVSMRGTEIKRAYL